MGVWKEKSFAKKSKYAETTCDQDKPRPISCSATTQAARNVNEPECVIFKPRQQSIEAIKRTILEHDIVAKRKNVCNLNHASHSFHECFSSAAQKICSTASTAARLREVISNEEVCRMVLLWEEKATGFFPICCTMKQKDLEDVAEIVYPLLAF